MNIDVDKKLKELLNKDYSVDYWDCYNDTPNSDEYMLEQAVLNSLIVVEEVLEVLNLHEIDKQIDVWEELKNKLIKMK